MASRNGTNGNGAHAPEKRLGKNGGGRLNSGNPGNKGNRNALGRPGLEVRAHCLQSFSDRIAKLEAIIDAKDANPKDVISAMELLGRYGGLAKIEVTGADDAPVVFTLALGHTLDGDDDTDGT